MAKIAAMIDLETLDTESSAQILTLGAVKFDPDTKSEPYAELYLKPDIDEQEALCRTVSESTLNDFWAHQPENIILEAFSEDDRISLDSLLDQLTKWLVGVDTIISQGHMDTNILEHLYKQMNRPVPWPHWKIDNSRSVFKMMPVDPRKAYSFDAHNALEDARTQARAFQDVIQHFDTKYRT